MSVRWPAYAAREAVLADLERAIAAAPAALDARFYQASFLRDHGQLDDALAGFEYILRRAPDHVETLVAYGVVLARRGRRLDARDAFARAVAADATHYGALVNLAGALALDEPDRAAALFAAAIAAAPAREPAHRGMCSLAAARGDHATAAHHRAAGYASGAVTARPYFGAAMPPRALALVSTDGGNLPVDTLLDPQRWFVHELAVEAYRDDAIPPYAIVVNAIADADRCGAALRTAERLADAMGTRTINAPAAVARTGRRMQHECFAGIDGVVVPASWKVRDVYEPPALPAIVRVPGMHMGRGAHLAADRDAYRAAVAEHAVRADIIGIAYVDTRSPDGAWRKYRVMIVDGRRYPLHLAIGERWSVHYFSAANAEHDAYRAEEARFLADPAGALGARAWAAIGAIGERLGLDYAGIDFGLDARGQVVLFEANAAMTVLAPDPDPRFAYRLTAYDNVRAAITRMIERT
jgi:tetratricopeptide (TPR) repeat protein